MSEKKVNRKKSNSAVNEGEGTEMARGVVAMITDDGRTIVYDICRCGEYKNIWRNLCQSCRIAELEEEDWKCWVKSKQ